MSSKATNILSSPRIPGIDKLILPNMKNINNLDLEMNDFSIKIK